MTRGSFGHNTSKSMRKCREDRMNRCIRQQDKEESQKMIDEFRKKEHDKMWKVVIFFKENYPYKIPDSVLSEIDATFKIGTKSQYGMILLLDRLVNWPEWKARAFKQFNIHIT